MNSNTIKIALAGNPNCGKTTLFNDLTGDTQYVGNWPGVTVEKKEGRLLSHPEVVVTDLPGIYSLSPYTMEEVVARRYLLDEHPDAILNIIDGTMLERHLYLTTQLLELGIPMVVAVNMIDVVRQNGDTINFSELSRRLGCRVVDISALKHEGTMEAALAAVEAAKEAPPIPHHTFSGPVEHVLAHIEEAVLHDLPDGRQRWYAIKLFERDSKTRERLQLPELKMAHIEADIAGAEKELDDNSESIITAERYVCIADILKSCYRKKDPDALTLSDRIDQVVTNRYLCLPIMAVILFAVYYIAMVGIGSTASEWMGEGVFGEGFHLFGIGAARYEEATSEYEDAAHAVQAFVTAEKAPELYRQLSREEGPDDPQQLSQALRQFSTQIPPESRQSITITDPETLSPTQESYTGQEFRQALPVIERYHFAAPEHRDYGLWIPGLPVLLRGFLQKIRCSAWLEALVVDGMLAGVGAVLGFVPQLMVLFLLLAILENCGYMVRIAFILDFFFRKFGLSGKSFIPILIGTGCGVPGIMASRTIENDRDRRMTIITTTFIPCGAKMPMIALIAGAFFNGAPWIATSAYFLGIICIIASGIILKKTWIFAGEPAPFVMELPAYHLPAMRNVLRSTWERSWDFMRKAGTIILLSSVCVWFASFFGVVDGSFRYLAESEFSCSLLARLGNLVAWLFVPLGWGTWQTTVASLTGLVAKENIVGTLAVLYKGGMDGNVYANLNACLTPLAAYSFLAFNLLCAPCFAAMGAIRNEMKNPKWTCFAISYQCIFAYAIAMIIYQVGSACIGQVHPIGLLISILLIIFIVYRLVKPASKVDSVG